ncbi:uncharacterized protein N7483_008366 [Penicillium malachiteum]|uniref:uncharacterized protein n=1 Tax=Penicillium malachiteum TaxID=1324776 RepID=UPI00254860AB|nr:uncharacterized protein N7483_008366 [Penicillium malachiteum]KAJ5720432.1 hypothetical protein N7483_008366 [Penicillium malachiteum]
MPINDYGVWRARPVMYKFEHDADDNVSPHLSLYFDDGQEQNEDYSSTNEFREHGRHKTHHRGPKPVEIPGLSRAAINIKSGVKQESRLVFWANRNFKDNPMVNKLAELPSGFNSLKHADKAPGGLRLDFIRGNLFNVNWGRLLPHDTEGPNILEPEVQKAIDQKAEIYLFGERFNTENGIHNIHMNQGNCGKWTSDDSIFQDGGLLIKYPTSGNWVGIFLGFAGQAVHTDNCGHAISLERWPNYLSSTSKRSDLIETSVSIDEASVEQHPSETRRRSVTLTNRTDHTIPLSSWKIKNSAGQAQKLPANAELKANSTNVFDISHVDLSNIADTVTLINEKGLKVDGVSYNSHPGKFQGQSVVFAH